MGCEFKTRKLRSWETLCILTTWVSEDAEVEGFLVWLDTPRYAVAGRDVNPSDEV
jgi:hypothetical protein